MLTRAEFNTKVVVDEWIVLQSTSARIFLIIKISFQVEINFHHQQLSTHHKIKRGEEKVYDTSLFSFKVFLPHTRY
jgi:hypothetical protein